MPLGYSALDDRVKKSMKAILQAAYAKMGTADKPIPDSTLQAYYNNVSDFQLSADYLQGLLNEQASISQDGTITLGVQQDKKSELESKFVDFVRVRKDDADAYYKDVIAKAEINKGRPSAQEAGLSDPFDSGETDGPTPFDELDLARQKAVTAALKGYQGDLTDYVSVQPYQPEGVTYQPGQQVFEVRVDTNSDGNADAVQYVEIATSGKSGESIRVLTDAPTAPDEKTPRVQSISTYNGQPVTIDTDTGLYYTLDGLQVSKDNLDTPPEKMKLVVGRKTLAGDDVYSDGTAFYTDEAGTSYIDAKNTKLEGFSKPQLVAGVTTYNGAELYRDSEGNYYLDEEGKQPYSKESVISEIPDTTITERVNADGKIDIVIRDNRTGKVTVEPTDMVSQEWKQLLKEFGLEEKRAELDADNIRTLITSRALNDELNRDRFKLDSELGRAAQSLNESRFNVEQLQFNANMAENARQFDEANRLNALAQQENARATNLEAGFQINKARSDAIDQTREILRNPADYVARGFSLAGQESPFTPVTQADLINKVTDDYNAYNDMLSTMGQGFDAQDYLAGRQGFAGGLEVEEAEHGGTFGNPVIVGDSSDGKENQELVMTANGAPMVVLPLTDQQINILQGNKNNNIPMAENGFQNPPEFNEFGESTTDPLTGRTDWSKVDTGGTIAPQGSMYSTKNNPMGTSQPSSMNFGTTTNRLTSFNDFVGFGNRMGQVGFGGTVVNQLPQRNLTQQDIIRQAERFGTPRVSRVAQGFSPMPMQFGFPLMSPGQLSSLTPDEREELRTRLATRNVSLGDVEQAVMQRFGPTGTRRGRRRF